MTQAPVPDVSVLLGVHGTVATITFNRPDLRNRLSPAVMSATRGFIIDAGRDPAVRVIVLTGTGGTFCAGADLRAAAGSSSESFAGKGPSELVALLRAILDCPKPTIARIQGHVAAGGNGIVASCDLAIAVADAKFAFTEVRLGLAPAVISVPCLAVMHRRDAQELLLTGERVDAERALRAGLITAVVAPERLDDEVERYARMLSLGGPEAMAHTKELLRRVPALPLDAAFEYTSDLSARSFSSAEGQQGMTAFLEKRSPSWAPSPEGSS